MKKLLFTVMLSMSAQAKQHVPDWVDICGQFASLGEGIMYARQSGRSMQEMIEIVSKTDGSKSDNDLSSDLIKITIAAYEKPRHDSEEAQQRSIAEFKNKLFLDCAKQISKDI